MIKSNQVIKKSVKQETRAIQGPLWPIVKVGIWLALIVYFGTYDGYCWVRRVMTNV